MNRELQSPLAHHKTQKARPKAAPFSFCKLDRRNLDGSFTTMMAEEEGFNFSRFDGVMRWHALARYVR
jgi:hypothetical protein